MFKELGIYSNHYGHFGRCTGPVMAEFMELDPELIKNLGEIAVRACLKDLS